MSKLAFFLLLQTYFMPESILGEELKTKKLPDAIIIGAKKCGKFGLIGFHRGHEL